MIALSMDAFLESVMAATLYHVLKIGDQWEVRDGERCRRVARFRSKRSAVEYCRRAGTCQLLLWQPVV